MSLPRKMSPSRSNANSSSHGNRAVDRNLRLVYTYDMILARLPPGCICEKAQLVPRACNSYSIVLFLHGDGIEMQGERRYAIILETLYRVPSFRHDINQAKHLSLVNMIFLVRGK
jgi:hypothetical protein